jgi:hypothetical protein
MRLFTRHRTAQAQRTEQPIGVRLIVLEDGAFSFEPPKPSSEVALEVAVLVQSASESPADLAERALRRMAALERSDRAVVEAIIAAGAAASPAAMGAREQISAAILAHMQRQGSGEIALAAGSDARPELRHELLELAGKLTGTAQSPTVGVRVLFGQQKPETERKSGVHGATLLPPNSERGVSVMLTG